MQLCTTNSNNAYTNFLNWIILEHIKKHNTIGKYNQRKVISLSLSLNHDGFPRIFIFQGHIPGFPGLREPCSLLNLLLHKLTTLSVGSDWNLVVVSIVPQSLLRFSWFLL